METNKTEMLQIGGHQANSQHRKKFALVDAEDLQRVAQAKWSIHSAGYAYRIKTRKGQKEMIYLHREVLNLKAGEGVVDHINGDPMDCRKENLRVLPSNAHNLQNRRRAFGSSSYRGVTFNKQKQRWIAQIGYNNQRFYGGTYQDEQKAALAAEALRRRYMDYALPDEKLEAELGERLDLLVQETAVELRL